MMMNGHFITLEGGEGAGKSTQIPLIKNYLEQLGKKVITLREPGGTPIAEQIRQILKTPRDDESLCDKTELLLMYAARAQLVETLIRPKLAQGYEIVCDRHDLSTLAYQGGGRGMDLEAIATLRNIALGGFRPSITFLLDLEPQQGLQRAQQRGSLDRFEQSDLEFFERVRNTYLSYQRLYPQEVKLINAQQNVAEVFANIKVHLDQIYAL